MPYFPLHGIVFFDIFQLLKDSRTCFESRRSRFLMDEVLATGRTLVAGVKLIHQCGAKVESVVESLKIEVLPGRKTFTGEFPDIALSSLFIK